MIWIGLSVIFAMYGNPPDLAYWAQITQAVHQNGQPIQSLKYPPMQCWWSCTYAIGEKKKGFYVTLKGLGWSDDGLHVCEEDIAECQGLLGTCRYSRKVWRI